METKYKFIRNGKEEETEVERWAWGVVYKDKTELHQFGADGMFHQIGEVDQDKVKFFVLYKMDNPEKRITIIKPEGAKLIHKYGRYILNVATEQERKLVVYVFGYKLGGQLHLNFVMPDDNIIQADNENVIAVF